MSDVVRYPFEKVENILYKQAYKVKRMLPNRYEVDELVNEAWIKGNIQKLDCIKYVAARAYWDMVDYVRQDVGRHFMRKDVKHIRPKSFTNMHDVKNSSIKEDKHCDWFFILEDNNKNHVDQISDIEEVNNFLSSVSDKKRDILKKYFMEEKTLKEISEEYGMTVASVCCSKQRSLKEIRQNFAIDEVKEKEKEKEKENIVKDDYLEEILPEYVADFEIDNKCAVEEDFVLERDLEK